MTAFTSAAPALARPDPAKHVNYTYGMVLGVDDFTQEFGYLSAHDRQAIAELVGYGRARGLAVTYQPADVPTARPPQLLVAPGLAVTPPGFLVTVDRAQCADLDTWMAAHRADVEAGLGGGAPHSGQLDLVVVLRYAECATDSRPVPGEPCRSQDDLMADSRLRDDFELELRRPPPADQSEVTAVRAFVTWLRQVPIDAAASSTLADFLAAILAASGVGQPPPADPCPAIGAFMTSPPPPGLAIPAARATDWLRAAFRLWTARLVPCWRVAVNGGTTADTADGGGLTLAAVGLDVLYDPVQDAFTVDPAMTIGPSAPVDQGDLPFLVSQRVLQEWALSAPSPVVPAPEPAIVAAGWLDPTGAAPAPPFFARGGLTATQRTAPDDTDVFDLGFDDFDPAAAYLITGTPVVDPKSAVHTLEAVTPGAAGTPAVRVRRATTPGSSALQGFQLQIVRFPT